MYFMSIMGMILTLIMIVAEVKILVSKEQDFTACSMVYYPGTIIVNMDVSMTAMVSALRFV